MNQEKKESGEPKKGWTESIQNHPMKCFLTTLFIGFLAGIGAYKGIEEIAKLEPISRHEYVKLKDEIKQLKTDFEKLKDDHANLEKKHTTLRNDYANLKQEYNALKNTQTPAHQPFAVQITSPSPNEQVDRYVPVKGEASGFADRYLWLVVHIQGYIGWWPQHEIRPNPRDGSWEVKATLGLEDGSGLKFDIIVVSVQEKGRKIYLDYLDRGIKTEEYPEIPLPSDAEVLDQVTVIRK